MKDFGYIISTYGVPACVGRRVIAHGNAGTIIRDMGNYIGVNFDSDKPGVAKPCHPTDEVEYLGMSEPRKPTRSQQRYLDYLDVGDCYESFGEYLKFNS